MYGGRTGEVVAGENREEHPQQPFGRSGEGRIVQRVGGHRGISGRVLDRVHPQPPHQYCDRVIAAAAKHRGGRGLGHLVEYARGDQGSQLPEAADVLVKRGCGDARTGSEAASVRASAPCSSTIASAVSTTVVELSPALGTGNPTG